MFAVYKKIISPESSPILGPASPNLVPINNSNNVNVNNAHNNATNANNNATNATNATNNATNAMESLSLCNYCCSTRSKCKKDDAPIQIPAQDKANAIQDNATQDKAMTQVPIKSKYEFGHATHYIYRVTTPRLLGDFETGTPP